VARLSRVIGIEKLGYMLETTRFRRVAISREVSYNRGMNIPITKLQRKIIIGNILGDGYICPSGFGTANLEIKQAKEKKEYVFWLYKKLRNLCKSSPRQRKDNRQWYFGTRYTQEFADLRSVFYPNNQKIVPENIFDLLKSSLSLAIWYMDDGTLDYRPKDHFAFYLMTHCFSVKDTYRLVKALRENFGIESTVFNNLIRGKRYSRIYIGTKGREKFLNLVKPYILNCFKHKLPPI